MGYVANYKWNSHDCTNSFLRLRGYASKKSSGIPFVIFDEYVYSVNNEFFYTLPNSYFLDNTLYDPVVLDAFTGVWGLNGDPSSISVDFTVMNVLIQSTGQKSFSTSHSVYLQDRTSILSTTHICFLDRSDNYDLSTTGYIFWDSHDISEVSDVTNVEYAYDTETVLTKSVYPEQSSGKLHLKKTANSSYGGIFGKVYVDVTALGGLVGNSLGIYLDYTAGLIGTKYLGQIGYSQGKGSSFKGFFDIPEDLMLEISDTSFNGTELYLTNTGSFSGCDWGIIDSFITFTPTQRDVLDTSHVAQIGAVLDLQDPNSDPIYQKDIGTAHYARVTKGQVYVLDYYTPSNWWSFTNKETYSYIDWNYYEKLAQYFGRFFHSPLYYNSQLPDFGRIILKASSGGSVSIISDYQSATRDTGVIDYTANGVSGFSLTPSVGSYLNLYNTQISPEVILSDGTLFKADTFVSDNTIGVVFREKSGGLFPYWTDSKKHPFMADQTLSITFFGKKG